MRPDDLRRLQVPFPENDQRGPTEQFRDALELGCPSVRTLANEILADLSVEHFGVGWWRNYVPSRRRILISDQLYLASWSIETNVAEARLHYLEALQFLDQAGASPAFAVYLTPQGEIEAHALPLPTAESHLTTEFVTLHIVGFLRAVSSAIDCLGASIVGVAALPSNILKAGMREARQALKEPPPNTPGGDRLRRLQARFEEVVQQAGPAGWLEWTQHYRNLLVHRGRHLQPWFRLPNGKDHKLEDGRTQLGCDAHLLLSRDPSRGEVDGWRDDNQHHALTEDARDTIRGIWCSTKFLIENVGAELLALWRERRADPALLTQPDRQWPNIDLPGPPPFAGYAPGTMGADEGDTELNTPPSFVHRMRAAALDGDRRARWSQLD